MDESPNAKLKLLQAALDAMPEGVVVFDPEGLPVHSNPMAKALPDGKSWSLQDLPENARLTPLGENGTFWGTLATFPHANLKSVAGGAEPEPEYRVLAETIPQIVFEAAQDGSFDFVNQRLIGYT